MRIEATRDVLVPGPVPVSIPPTVQPPTPPSEPTSPASLMSDDSSYEDQGFPGFRSHDYDQQLHSPVSITVDNPTPPQAPPSLSSYFPTTPPKLPVSLPLDSPQWTGILAANDDGTAAELAKVVEEDSRRARRMKDVQRLREYNIRASIAGQPLAPIPNDVGLVLPLGYNNPITSTSQLVSMSAVELNAWLFHYALPFPKGSGTREAKRTLLTQYLGIDTRFQ